MYSEGVARGPISLTLASFFSFFNIVITKMMRIKVLIDMINNVMKIKVLMKEIIRMIKRREMMGITV